jgi:hypothetical protein
MRPTATVLVYSDDANTREQVRLATGRRPAADLPPVEFVECATLPAVLAALEDGRLPAERFSAWEKLQRELAWVEQRTDPLAATRRRRQVRAISKSVRANKVHRGRD